MHRTKQYIYSQNHCSSFSYLQCFICWADLRCQNYRPICIHFNFKCHQAVQHYVMFLNRELYNNRCGYLKSPCSSNKYIVLHVSEHRNNLPFEFFRGFNNTNKLNNHKKLNNHNKLNNYNKLNKLNNTNPNNPSNANNTTISTCSLNSIRYVIHRMWPLLRDLLYFIRCLWYLQNESYKKLRWQMLFQPFHSSYRYFCQFCQYFSIWLCSEYLMHFGWNLEVQIPQNKLLRSDLVNYYPNEWRE